MLQDKQGYAVSIGLVRLENWSSPPKYHSLSLPPPNTAVVKVLRSPRAEVKNPYKLHAKCVNK